MPDDDAAIMHSANREIRELYTTRNLGFSTSITARPQLSPLVMALNTTATDTVAIADELYGLYHRHQDDPSLFELKELSSELRSVSSSMFRLRYAMVIEWIAYKLELEKDLIDINEQVGFCLDEICDCLQMLQHAYGNRRGVFCPWFFKKGHIPCMVKYLQVLKTQMCLMRVVLFEVTCVRLATDSQISIDINFDSLVINYTILPAALEKYERLVQELHKYDQDIDQISTQSPLRRVRSGGLHQAYQQDIHSAFALAYHSSLSLPGLTDDEGSSPGEFPATVRSHFTTRIHVSADDPSVKIPKTASALRAKYIYRHLVVAEPEETTALRPGLLPVILDDNLDLVGTGATTASVEDWLAESSDGCWSPDPRRARRKKSVDGRPRRTPGQLVAALQQKLRASGVGRLVAGGLRALAVRGLLGKKKKIENTRLV